MCLIIDANAADRVFGESPSPGESRLLRWLESGSSRLVIGGSKMQREMFDGTSHRTRRWLALALTRGLLQTQNDRDVDQVELSLVNLNSCKSNDEHIIAAAQVSGARLLYSDDGELNRDFVDRALLNRPPGKQFPIDGTRQQQETLLNRGRICVSNACRRRG